MREATVYLLKAGSKAEFIEKADTLGQKTRQQRAQAQPNGTNRSVCSSSLGEFWWPSKILEGFGMVSSFVVSRKGAFSKEMFGKNKNMRNDARIIRLRIPRYGDEVETGSEDELRRKFVVRQIRKYAEQLSASMKMAAPENFLTKKETLCTTRSLSMNYNHK